MKTFRKPLIVILALLAFGVLRLVPEQRFSDHLRETGLRGPRIEIETSERLGQTGAVVAFGGLRTLIAALWNLRAFGFFERRDWFRVEESYETIVTLAPQTRYYWDTGAWHIAYNASINYKEQTDLPPLRRHQKWADAIARGAAMLEQGIRNNPDDWTLPNRLGSLYSDANKIVDFSKAAHWFKRAAENGAPGYVVRAHLYALARIPGREQETLDEARRLHAEPRNRVPTFNCVHFVAETQAAPERPIEERILGSFESNEQAWRELRLHLDRKKREQFPQTGVKAALRWLQQRVDVKEIDRLPEN